jgi:multiple antibiotic resistance protein
MELVTVIITLLFIMDPLGNMNSFLKMVDGIPRRRQYWIILREMLIALSMMLLFNFIGEGIFSVLGLSQIAVAMSAGVILFLTALKAIYPNETSPRSKLPTGEPFIVPMAIPLIAGPSLMAMIMLYAHMEPSQPLMLTAILVSWAIACLLLVFSHGIKQGLKTNGLLAAEKLTAMILIMLAIQRFMDGVSLFIQTNG